MSKHYTYLALGDSYTIGEGVPLHESFPYQLVQILRNAQLHFHAPEIIAKTGWTSFELAEHLLHTKLDDNYDFVTLLIGVNNQYRGLPLADFESDFGFLLRKAIHLSGEKPIHVIVLSIPDWGQTPFAKDRDASLIADEIAAFNNVCRQITERMEANFVDITAGAKKSVADVSLFAADGLHYSAKTHATWAEKVAAVIRASLLQQASNK
jgi:lysophospholipase L1-like esterase